LSIAGKIVNQSSLGSKYLPPTLDINDSMLDEDYHYLNP